jgi:nucleoid-associated protein YgaU
MKRTFLGTAVTAALVAGIAMTGCKKHDTADTAATTPPPAAEPAPMPPATPPAPAATVTVTTVDLGNAGTVPAGTANTYTVQKGDTLSAIAQHHYGKASRWHAIFEANRDQLDDPDLIRPGQVLKLPQQ